MGFAISVDDSPGYTVVTLTDKTGGSEVELFSFGGLLNSFRVPMDGVPFNIVAGFENIAAAVKNITRGFKSAKLSPYVCRMNKGDFDFNGQHYHTQKFYLHQHAIHGLIYDAVYTVSAKENNDDHASVTFTHTYNGSDPGFPFVYRINIKWILQTGNKLTVQTTVTNTGSGPMPLADGWHPYFTLGGKVDDWQLCFSASNQLEYDEELIPTGKTIADTRFLSAASLKNIFLDNGFLFTDPTAQNKCVLSNDRLQLQISPDESYPVLQVYIPPARDAIAIENLSGAPDNFNNEIGLVILAPGETKAFTTSYTVTVS